MKVVKWERVFGSFKFQKVLANIWLLQRLKNWEARERKKAREYEKDREREDERHAEEVGFGNLWREAKVWNLLSNT